MGIARGSLQTLGDPQKSDVEKERILRGQALHMLYLLLILGTLIAGAVFIPVGMVYGMSMFGFVDFDRVIAVSVSPVFLLTAVFLATVYYLVKGRLRERRRGQAELYSAADKQLFRFAFATTRTQLSLSRFEDRLVRARKAQRIDLSRPVFISGLPRAGTTILLEVIHNLPGFRTHTYRDMPFLFTPILWRNLSRLSSRKSVLMERPHHDGLMVGLDSPEALEEMLWKAFWPNHYSGVTISPFDGETESNPHFDAFFRKHMEKLLLVKGAGAKQNLRYVSKNNLNISRLGYLRKVFPKATILVPFRDPLQHAASLMKQHENFLRLHQEDDFYREYMEAVGHYDFGRTLKPINFDGWYESRSVRSTMSVSFWLEYWSATYGYLLRQSQSVPKISFVGFEQVCLRPHDSLMQIMEAAGYSEDEDFVTAQAARFKLPREHFPVMSDTDAEKLKQCQAVFRSMEEISLTGNLSKPGYGDG